MTKDAVIDVIHKTIYGFFDVVADDSEEPISEKDKMLLEVNKAVCNAVKEMPDDKCRWIPVTERLPEEDGRYLCTYKNDAYGDGICIDFGLYEDGEWYVSGAIAWMPLPKPYEEGAEE